jgi:hypothetical protein
MTTEAITPLRQRMIEDMNSRKLGAHTQRSHITRRSLGSSFPVVSLHVGSADAIRFSRQSHYSAKLMQAYLRLGTE